MAAELTSVPEKGAADVAYPVDIALRFALLAYSRNDAEGIRYQFLQSSVSGKVEAIEIQLHGTDDFRAGAHAVLYIYRLKEGGVEVVLSYKGSTLNVEDWAHNLCFATVQCGIMVQGSTLFPDAEDGSELQGVKVHTGFKAYKKTLDARMRDFSMEPLSGLLTEWGAAPEHANLYAWLHSPTSSRKHCTVVGHSLGGAMATMAAVELAGGHGGGNVMLVTFAAPAVGNQAFVAVQNACVRPCGGLRIYNHGDTVPMLGYSGVAVRPTSQNLTGSKYHGGLRLPLWGKARHQVDPYHIHLRFTVPSHLNSKDKESSNRQKLQWLTCKFPGTTYKPSATDDFIEYTLGDAWTVSGGGKQEVSKQHRMADPLGAFSDAQKKVTENARSVACTTREFAASSCKQVCEYSTRPLRRLRTWSQSTQEPEPYLH